VVEGVYTEDRNQPARVKGGGMMKLVEISKGVSTASIICNCGITFIGSINKEPFGDNCLTRINACPCCNRRWRLSSVSGVKWRYYKELKKVIERYKWK